MFVATLQDFCLSVQSSRGQPFGRNKPDVHFNSSIWSKSCCRVLQHVLAWPEWGLQSTRWKRMKRFKGATPRLWADVVFLLRWTGLNSLCQGPGEAGGFPVFTWNGHWSSLQKCQLQDRIDRQQGWDQRRKMTPRLLIIFKMELFCGSLWVLKHFAPHTRGSGWTSE